MRNSWGQYWGENGFFRVKRNVTGAASCTHHPLNCTVRAGRAARGRLMLFYTARPALACDVNHHWAASGEQKRKRTSRLTFARGARKRTPARLGSRARAATRRRARGACSATPTRPPTRRTTRRRARRTTTRARRVGGWTRPAASVSSHPRAQRPAGDRRARAQSPVMPNRQRRAAALRPLRATPRRPRTARGW